MCISKAEESFAASLNNTHLEIVHTFWKHVFLRCSSNENKPNLALKKKHADGSESVMGLDFSL